MFPKPLNDSLAGMVLTAILLVAPSALAHLMPAGKGTINLVGPKAYVVVSLPLAAFELEGAPDQNKPRLQAQVRAGLELWSGDQPGSIERVLLNLPAGADHQGEAGAELVAMVVVHFNEPPESLRLVSRIWAPGVDGLAVKVTESRGQTTVRSELGELSADRPEFLFFASSGTVFSAAFGSGFAHWVRGLDHLLFVALLLLLQVAAARWLRVVSYLTLSFVAAFYIMMSAGPRLSAAWIEWGIALTVLAAAAVLRHSPRGRAMRWEGVWILPLGLLHGLGFAAASVQAGFAEHMPWVKLVGVNLAVAVGLGLLAVLVGGIVWMGRQGFGESFESRASATLQLVGAIAGTYWLVERTLQL